MKSSPAIKRPIRRCGRAPGRVTADPDFGCKLQILRQQAGFESAASSKLVRPIEATTGRAAMSIPFGSEANLLASVAEEVIVFGPGDMQDSSQ